jgi:hypothetical protein
MGSKPSTALAATVVAVALASFPAGAAAVKDYSQNSVNGEAAAPLPAELLKDYSMNAATGDYAPPIHHARPTRVGRIHDDAGATAPGPQPSSTSEGRFGQVGGWIAYSSGDGIWAVDPARPERQIRLSRADGDPIGWSSDGTKLLIRRKSPNQVRGGVGETDLFVFDADGTETRLTNAQTLVTGGSFSPDGSEVVYATTFSPKGSAIYAVNSDGGLPG